MVKKIVTRSFEEFQSAIKSIKSKDDFVLCFFAGSEDENGHSWCPDCVAAKPILEAALEKAPEDVTLITCYIERAVYGGDATRRYGDTDFSKVMSRVCLLHEQHFDLSSVDDVAAMIRNMHEATRQYFKEVESLLRVILVMPVSCCEAEQSFSVLSWKDMKNPFRTDKNLELKCVPTLIRWGTAQRLDDTQCQKKNMVEMLLED